ncbi:hypothetical protein CGGC5_v013593 [Colletotrichum fructicola Nara gc5]|uniref:Uncharacterized protein n=1 Tax=Colletotrichum fructicola (strain Nara gc5) TaxID=1213859 RepID=L2GAN5_COLFN|nr:hypothetical protein CGGC5_v013593 [Colletotrichum fructicola Nara gc5]
MFESFIDDVVGQRISYDLNIALLLDALDVSEEERKRLYDGTEPGLWHERHIEAEIRRKVKEEHFRWLICRFQNVGAALDELRQLLAIDKSRARRIESKTYRLATSVSNRKDELLTKLKKNNDDIRRYLDGAMDLNFTFDSASRPSPGNGTHWKSYEKVQDQAEELFRTLQEHWPDNCVCSSGHPCGITAQRRQNSDEEGESIALMFNPLGYDQGLHVRVRVSQDGPQEMGKMRSESDDAVDKLDELSQRLSASNALKKLKQKRNFARWFSPELFSIAPPKEASTNAQPNQSKAQHIDASEQENTSLPIQNLCESIAFAPAKPYVGFLKSKNNQHIYFHSAPWRQAEEPIEVESLDSVIRTQIYRAKRLRIGLSTVLLLACIPGRLLYSPTSYTNLSLTPYDASKWTTFANRSDRNFTFWELFFLNCFIARSWRAIRHIQRCRWTVLPQNLRTSARRWSGIKKLSQILESLLQTL